MNVRFVSQAYGVSGVGEYGNHHDRVAAVKTLLQQREWVAMGGCYHDTYNGQGDSTICSARTRCLNAK